VLTSTVTNFTDPANQTAFTMYARQITVPTLVVNFDLNLFAGRSHIQSRCLRVHL
jgi:hypothetical protein